MSVDQLLGNLERIVHELWRAKMVREGWTAGLFEPEAHRHDALVPFEDLLRADRLALALYVRGENFEEVLPRLLEYARGPDRPFLAEEMRKGLRVAFCGKGCPRTIAEVKPGDMGEIESWTVNEQHELAVIRVRWDDESIEVYSPWERSLARAEELR